MPRANDTRASNNGEDSPAVTGAPCCRPAGPDYFLTNMYTAPL